MKRYAILFMLLIFACIACKKDKKPTPSGIIGNWRWIQTHGGIAGIQETPATTGHNLHYVFRTDSSCTIISDSNAVKTRYSISKDTSYIPGQFTNMITIIGAEPYGVLTMMHDSLIIADSYVDGYDYIFVRE